MSRRHPRELDRRRRAAPRRPVGGRIPFPGIAALAAATLALGLAGAAPAAAAPPTSGAVQATEEVPEARLLDVGILVFAPGLPEGDPAAREEEGVFPELRRAEARYFPVHLQRTLTATGQWGAVRVLPGPTETVDLTVSGEILESTGKELKVRVEVTDATGRTWLDDKYKAEAEAVAYRDEAEVVSAAPRDPFQAIYDEIANDLLARREKRDDAELTEVRWVSTLRYVRALSPEAFSGYLTTDRKGRWEVDRLPAEGDPMLERAQRIEQREYLLVDTFHEHYADLYRRMGEPYDQWRAYSYEEQKALEELRRQARWRKILGAAAIAGAVLSDSDGRAAGAARDAAVIGGVIAIQSGMEKSAEAKIHRAALSELAASFDGEVEPLVVEVEGQILRLQGTAETQFAEWRELLRRIWAAEVGEPLDPNRRPGAEGGAAGAVDGEG